MGVSKVGTIKRVHFVGNYYGQGNPNAKTFSLPVLSYRRRDDFEIQKTGKTIAPF